MGKGIMTNSIGASGQGAATPTPSQWREDLAYLVKELPSRHINLFARISEDEFRKRAAKLNSEISTLNQVQTLAGLVELVAAVGDAHTHIPILNRPGMHFMPLLLEFFSDGLFVVMTSEEYRKLAGAKVEQIGGMSTAQALEVLKVLVPHENEAKLKTHLPCFLVATDLLTAMGVTRTPDCAALTVLKQDGERVTIDIYGVPTNTMPKLTPAYTGPQPLYLCGGEKPYWFHIIDGGKTVYFQYSKCIDTPKLPFRVIHAGLRRILTQQGIQRLIVDLRNNEGGDSRVLDPWIDEIKQSSFNQKKRLFVIVGRRTFSSAMLNAIRLRNEAHAILAGEPTGGKPNHFGEVRPFELPHSRLKVFYSTKYFSMSSEDTPSLMPEIPIEPTSHDYLTGTDPVLETILGQSPG
jgi:hypothetical protein